MNAAFFNVGLMFVGGIRLSPSVIHRYQNALKNIREMMKTIVALNSQ